MRTATVTLSGVGSDPYRLGQIVHFTGMKMPGAEGSWVVIARQDSDDPRGPRVRLELREASALDLERAATGTEGR